MKTFILSFLLLMFYPGKRQVLVFYNEKGAVLKDKQLAIFKENAKGLADRDMTVQTYSTTTAKEEVKQWHIDADKPFTVLLVGKDGGEKLRSDTVVLAVKIFNTIDAMPMRKSEMED